jgi:hypothetical protein
MDLYEISSPFDIANNKKTNKISFSPVFHSYLHKGQNIYSNCFPVFTNISTFDQIKGGQSVCDVLEMKYPRLAHTMT